MVTHNIEEAVLMCDRILVLASNPGISRLPQVSTNRIGGVVETLASPAYGGYA
jgi:ABC-type nitrate/sulfonate/bicarbonate transport system ATPase subunit